MKYKILLSVLVVLFLVSCNRSNLQKITGTTINSDKLVETSETSVKTFPVHREGTINADCDYSNEYNRYVGKLKKGDRVIVFLDRNNNYNRHSYEDENKTMQLDARVEVKTENDGVSMWIREQYITYDDECYNAWFKNMLLVREYYYTCTPEYIFEKDNAISYKNWGKIGGDNVERELMLRNWLPDVIEGGDGEEGKLRISENHFILGPGYGDIFRIKFVTRNENIYKLYLSDSGDIEIEVTLADNGDGVIMTECVVIKEGIFKLNKSLYIQSLLNIKYVPYDKEKSERSREAIYAWINEQLEILAPINKKEKF